MVTRLVAHQGLSVTAALAAVDLPKSSYYYRPRARPPRALDRRLVGAIDAILARERQQVYGYRKIHAVLRAQGWRVNRKKVLRHVRAMHRLQLRKRPGIRWTRPRLVQPTRMNTYWEMDTTMVWCGPAGRHYLCAVTDAYDHGIPGACFSPRCRAAEAISALEEAVTQRFGGRVPSTQALTLRVDRGSQFIAHRFRHAAATLGVQLEYAGIQCPNDMPYIESFFGKYKTEEVYRMDYASYAEGHTAWVLYRRWYETERVHQSLGYRTPQQVADMVHHHFSPALGSPV